MFTRFLSAALAMSVLLPSAASAKIWPDDFTAPSNFPLDEMSGDPTENGSLPLPTVDEEQEATNEAVVPPTVIADGAISRIDFIAAIVSRSATPAELDSCFFTLGASPFSLLFRDVSVEHMYAKQLCVAMMRGYVRGYGDGLFRPDEAINGSEAAMIFAKITGTVPGPVLRGEAWYAPVIRAVKAQGMELPSQAHHAFTGVMLKKNLCKLGETTPGSMFIEWSCE